MDKLKSIIYKVLPAIIIVFFIFKCSYFSHDLKTGILPDEITHLKVIDAFYNSDSFRIDPITLGPSNAAAISQDKFLYHLIVAKSAQLLGVSLDNINFFRAWSILFGTLTVLIFHLLTRYFFVRKSLRILSLIIFSNILMFTASSSSISYDPLTNLISIGIIFLFFSYLNKRTYPKLYAISILTLLGTFTKTSVLPFIPIIGLVGILNHKELSEHLRGLLTKVQLRQHKILITSFGLVILFSSSIILNNYISYNKMINVRCGNIFTPEICKEKDPLSKWYSSLKESNKNLKRSGIFGYYDNWNDVMIQYTFGIAAHEFMTLNDSEYRIVKILLLLSLLGWPLCIKKKYMKEIMTIFLTYSLIILIYVNYRSYLSHGDLSAGIHGRYLFPVLSAGVIIFVQSLELLSQKIKSPIILPFLAASIFLYLDFPAYLNDENLIKFNKTLHHQILQLQPLVSLESGAKVHIDYVSDYLVEEEQNIFRVSDDFEIRGWAFDERLSKLGQDLLFNLDNGDFKKAVYKLQRSDVARAYDNPDITRSGFLIRIPFEELRNDTTQIRLFIQYEEGLMYNNHKEILIIK